MNKHSYHIILFTMLLALGACNRQLDLKPEGTMIESELLRYKQTTENYLADTYLRMMNGSSPPKRGWYASSRASATSGDSPPATA